MTAVTGILGRRVSARCRNGSAVRFRSEVAELAASWVSAGTRVVSVVDRGRSSVTIQDPGAAFRRAVVPEALDGAPLVPAFRPPIAHVFAE